MEHGVLALQDIYEVINRFDHYDKIIFGIGNICKGAYEHNILPPKATYFTSAWGCVIPYAMGYSLASKEKNILVVDGDGSFLHSPSFLATLSSLEVSNLHILIVDNGCYDSTGGQQIAAFSSGIKLSNIIKGYGFTNVSDISHVEELSLAVSTDRLKKLGPYFTIVKTKPTNKSVSRIPTEVILESFE